MNANNSLKFVASGASDWYNSLTDVDNTIVYLLPYKFSTIDELISIENTELQEFLHSELETDQLVLSTITLHTFVGIDVHDHIHKRNNVQSRTEIDRKNIKLEVTRGHSNLVRNNVTEKFFFDNYSQLAEFRIGNHTNYFAYILSEEEIREGSIVCIYHYEHTPKIMVVNKIENTQYGIYVEGVILNAGGIFKGRCRVDDCKVVAKTNNPSIKRLDKLTDEELKVIAEMLSPTLQI